MYLYELNDSLIEKEGEPEGWDCFLSNNRHDAV